MTTANTQQPSAVAFRLRRVAAPLAQWVAGIWAVAGVVPVAAETVLPNGVVELIFNLGPAHRVIAQDGSDTDRWYRRAWLAGMQQGPLTIASQGRTALIGVRFRPGGAAALLDLPLATVTDEVVDIDDLDPPDRSLSELEDRLAGVDIDTGIDLVEQALRHRLATRRGAARGRGQPDRRVAAAIAALPQATSVRSLADGVGVSHKHLITLFHDEVGVTPSRLRRIHRFDRLLGHLVRDPHPNWAAVAVDHGFSDQAHMAREVRSFAGVTPTTLLATLLADQHHLDASGRVAP